MDKKEFIAPIVEHIHIEDNDIISTSGNYNRNNHEHGEGNKPHN